MYEQTNEWMNECNKVSLGGFFLAPFFNIAPF